jgi:hypothetical protein
VVGIDVFKWLCCHRNNKNRMREINRNIEEHSLPAST